MHSCEIAAWQGLRFCEPMCPDCLERERELALRQCLEIAAERLRVQRLGWTTDDPSEDPEEIRGARTLL